jgi:N-acetylneuraminic acid mutarotase
VIVIFLLFLAFQLIGEGSINIPGFNSNGQGAEEEPAALNVQIGESRWFSAPAMPRPASNMALVAIGLNLYQIGGEVEAGVVNLVNIYETDSGEWRSGAAKPTAVADVTAAVLFGEIFVPGGRLADERPTSVVEAYSPANNAWRQVAPLPVPISGGLTLSDGRLLYIFGGWDGAGYLAEGFVYDPSTDAWQSLPSMPTGRAFAAGGFLLGNLYVVGGQNEQGELAVCENFDPIAQSWQECPALTQPRAGAGAAVLVAAENNSLYIIGGGVEEQTLDSEFFSDETGGWQPVEMPMLKDDSWHHLAVTNVETRIYALGGRQGGAILETVYVYSPLINRIYFPSVAVDR